MTFEAFFIKKKIDLQLLKQAEPLLYQEFKSHFELMGEKSFDHTKKFWFNRLRKHFHLKEESIASPSQSPVITTTEPKESDITASGQSAKPTGFKPRFKANTSPQKTITADSADVTSSEKQSVSDEKTVTTKPTGFKPRFKATSPPKTSETDASAASTADPAEKTTQENTAAAPKPTGFKPRFKAGITKKVDEETTTETTKEPVAQKSIEPAQKGKPDDPTKPLGFKPRFKPKGD